MPTERRSQKTTADGPNGECEGSRGRCSVCAQAREIIGEILHIDGGARVVVGNACFSSLLCGVENGAKTQLQKGNGGQGRNRTADASLFRAALYQLSYLATFKSLAGMQAEADCPEHRGR
jgi:hypothetical protein